MKKRVQAAALTIRVALVPGRCRWCGCTDNHGCAMGCSWVDRAATLCSECATVDKAMRSARGRKTLTEFLQDTLRLELL